MAIIKKIFEIKECNESCPFLFYNAYGEEECLFYNEEYAPWFVMKPKDKKPKYCKVKRVIVEIEID